MDPGNSKACPICQKMVPRRFPVLLSRERYCWDHDWKDRRIAELEARVKELEARRGPGQ